MNPFQLIDELNLLSTSTKQLMNIVLQNHREKASSLLDREVKNRQKKNDRDGERER